MLCWKVSVFFCVLRPPPEGPGGCLGKVLGVMLEDFGSKRIFSWLSWAMFGHPGLGVAILVGWLAARAVGAEVPSADFGGPPPSTDTPGGGIQGGGK